MKNNRIIKVLTSGIVVLLLMVATLSCSDKIDSKTGIPEVSAFEKNYAISLANTRDDYAVSVVGMASMTYSEEETEQFRAVYSENEEAIDLMDNICVIDNGNTVSIRMYFPLANAELAYGSECFVTNHKGEFMANEPVNLSKLRLISHTSSDSEKKVPKKKNKPLSYSTDNNVVFFDVGIITNMH